jgi:hypothetical protein
MENIHHNDDSLKESKISTTKFRLMTTDFNTFLRTALFPWTLETKATLKKRMAEFA